MSTPYDGKTPAAWLFDMTGAGNGAEAYFSDVLLDEALGADWTEIAEDWWHDYYDNSLEIAGLKAPLTEAQAGKLLALGFGMVYASCLDGTALVHTRTGSGPCSHREPSSDKARERRARRVLLELVRLKDGPRDEEYRAAKKAAWERARELLR